MRKWISAVGVGVLGVLASAVAMTAVPFVHAQQTQEYRYVALGDSVAAGAGLSLASTSQTDALCQRSDEAYPQRIAAHYNIVAENIACTGAKVNDGIYGAQERNDIELAPQLDAAFQAGTPNLITMTAGANDLRWTSFIKACALYDCDNAVYRGAARVLLADLTYELNRTLLEIEQRSDGDAPVVAMGGYYTPLLDGSCTEALGINTAERDWINGVGEQVNERIERAASRYDFATFVSVDFSGHGICSQDSWLQDVNDPMPYHPTATGQRAIADAFLEAFAQRY